MQVVPHKAARAALLLAGLALTGQASAQGQAPNAQAPVSETIVVTAAKRSESLLKAAQSVVALSGRQLQAQGARSFRDYIDRVPSLNVEAGGGGQVRYNVRGIAALSPVNNDIATVGYYLDEVPISESSVGADITPFDLQRIEVLRGPQGTLYGEGSIGGTIKVITNKPDARAVAGTIEGSLSGTAHGGLNNSGDAMFNLPIVQDQLAVRGVVTHTGDNGYLQNPIDHDQNVNYDDRTSGRLAVRWTPNADLTVDASGLGEYERAGALNYDFSINPAVVPNTEGINTTAFGGPPLGGTVLIPNQAADYTSLDAFQDQYISHRYIANLTINYDLGWAQLLSSSSYYKLLHDQDFDSREDSATIEQAGASLGLPIAVTGGTRSLVRTDSEVKSQEFRLTSPGDQRFRWLAGAFYRERSNDFNYYQSNEFVTKLLGLGPTFTAQQTVDFTQYALFGEATYDILPTLHLTGGLRAFNENVTGSGQITTINTGFLPNAPFLSSVAFPSGGGQEQRQVLFKASLAYDFSPDLHGYLLFSEGTRPGGLNQRLLTPYLPQFFRSDSTKNYEAGLKGQFLDRRLIATLAVFQIDWSNTQVYIDSPPSGQNIYNLPGGSRVRGIEFDGSYKLSPDVIVGGVYGYLDTSTQGSLTYFNSLAGATTSTLPGGLALPYVPRSKASVFAEYTKSFGNYDVAGRVDDQYVTSRLPYLGSPYVLAPYNRLNAQVSARRFGLKITIFADNLLDRRIETLGTTPGYFGVAIDRPLTAGVRVSQDF